ncbi:MAG: Phage tail sheath protein [Syntrophus sp. PtaB.Bin001]|nr:MAG: Phage tail sheath protein [Syntrophus sp. PtaB.Bin001]
MISFNQIPIDIRVPGVYIETDNSLAVGGLPTEHHLILVMGQRLSAGTVAALTPTRITNKKQGEAYFGRGSQLSSMINALKDANGYTECWAVAVDDDAAGMQAAGSILIGGTITAAGTLYLYIGGKRVKVAVTAGEATTAIATALTAAINEKTELPVTAAVDGTNQSKVNLTCRWKGESGNYIDIRTNYYQSEKLPTGMTVTITVMTGGTANPDIADAIAAIGDEQYHTIIIPWTDAANLAALYTEMQRRWGPLVKKEGMAFSAASGTHAALSTLGNSLNDELLCVMGAQASPTTPWEIAAIVGAIDAYESDPARPRQTLTLTGVLAPWPEDRYTLSERNIHLYDGISTFTVDDGGLCRIERLITTYKTNALGVDDISYLDVETLRTIAYLRYSTRVRIALRYPRHKLASDGTEIAPGQAIVTPKVIRSELIALFIQWMEAGLVEGLTQFKKDLLVERNTSDPNRVDAVIPPDVINQFRVFAASLQFRM